VAAVEVTSLLVDSEEPLLEDDEELVLELLSVGFEGDEVEVGVLVGVFDVEGELLFVELVSVVVVGAFTAVELVVVVFFLAAILCYSLLEVEDSEEELELLELTWEMIEEAGGGHSPLQSPVVDPYPELKFRLSRQSPASHPEEVRVACEFEEEELVGVGILVEVWFLVFERTSWE